MFGAKPLNRIVPMGGGEVFYVVGGILVILAIFLPAITYSLMRAAAIKRIGSRSEKLFAIDGGCIYVRIESPMTYKRFKLVAEDMGLLKITPEYIQLEMTRHRAQVETQRVKVSLMRVSKSIAGVHMRYDYEPASWEVVIGGPVFKRSVWDEIIAAKSGETSAARAMRLLALLRDAGAEVAEGK